jgi:ammonium transporter Rh
MEVVLNATLAGGVSVGSSSDLVVTGSIAMAIGAIAGIISALGFLYLSKFLKEKIGLYDTCGVHNLHGMPGVLGAIFGAISAGASGLAFGDDTAAQVNTFAAMAEPPLGVGRTAAG